MLSEDQSDQLTFDYIVAVEGFVISIFADSVTVDAISRNRENFLSTLSVIAVKEEMR